jgi:hypothetical protein
LVHCETWKGALDAIASLDLAIGYAAQKKPGVKTRKTKLQQQQTQDDTTTLSFALSGRIRIFPQLKPPDRVLDSATPHIAPIDRKASEWSSVLVWTSANSWHPAWYCETAEACARQVRPTLSHFSPVVVSLTCIASVLHSS